MQPSRNVTKHKGGNPAFYKGMPALNPHGRPKGIISFKSCVERVAKETILRSIKDGGKNRREYITKLEDLARTMLEHGRNGDARYADILLERLEGKVTQPVKFEDSTINITLNGKEIGNGQDQH
jgi:hypothetical protein